MICGVEGAALVTSSGCARLSLPRLVAYHLAAHQEVVLTEEDDMKSPCAMSLHNAVTVSQQRMGKRVPQLSPARMDEVCAAPRLSLGCDSN
jgi:mRNA-degrading endonuclease toxin of MazEF toxin-antitoxin module